MCACVCTNVCICNWGRLSLGRCRDVYLWIDARVRARPESGCARGISYSIGSRTVAVAVVAVSVTPLNRGRALFRMHPAESGYFRDARGRTLAHSFVRSLTRRPAGRPNSRSAARARSARSRTRRETRAAPTAFRAPRRSVPPARYLPATVKCTRPAVLKRARLLAHSICRDSTRPTESL